MERAREMRKWGLDVGLHEMAFLLSLDRGAVRLRRPPTSLLVGWVVPGAVKASAPDELLQSRPAVLQACV